MRTLVPRTMVPVVTVLLLAACQSAVPSTPLAPTGPPVDQNDGNTDGLVIEGTQIQLLESYPVQVVLVVEGTKPTPCHELGWEVSDPDATGRIDVELSSTIPPDVMCVQVLEAFEARIPLGSFETGSFSVWLNGERVGEFEL